VLHVARRKYRTQKNLLKIRHLGTITQLCRAVSSELSHVSTIGKNLLNRNFSRTCPHNMMAAESGSLVWAPQLIQRVSHLGSDTAQHSSSGRQPNFAAVNRERHLYSAGRPSRWALAHLLVK